MLLNLLKKSAGYPVGVSQAKLFDWERLSGVETSPERIMEEIERSISDGNVQRALELLPAVFELSESVRFKAARLIALIRCGHLSIAMQEVMGLPMADWLLNGEGDFRDWPGIVSIADQVANIRLAYGIIEYFAHSGASSAAEQFRMIERVGEVVRDKYEKNLLGDKAYKICTADGSVALAQLSMHFGHSRWIENQIYVHPDLQGGMLSQWQVALDTALVWAGRVDGGVHRRSEMTLLNHQSFESGSIARDARLQLFGLKLVSGDWVAAKAILDDGWMGGKSATNLNHESLLYSGLLDSLMGRHQEAIAKFGPEVLQLKTYDPRGLLRLALAATASSYAALGDLEAGRAALFSIDVAADTKSFTSGRFETLFHIQALHDLGNMEAAATAWLETVGEDRRRGNASWALLEATVAISHGYLEFVDALGELVPDVSGRFSEACGQFVEAFRAHRRDPLLSAAASMEELGHLRLSGVIREIATFGDDGTPGSRAYAPNRSGTVGAPGLEASIIAARALSVSPLHEDAMIREHWLKHSVEQLGLTTRQAEIARLAGLGSSNREIAEELDMSIRTAESHLYQIFGKLGVRKRSDLNRLLQVHAGLIVGNTGSTS
ncbi:hypothetical protein GCM10023166_24890 [Paeniglutamicibacter cryotolerans]